MRKLLDKNINTPEYWDSVYSAEIANQRQRIALDRFDRITKLIPNNSNILDVGCGTGDFIRYLEAHRPDCKISGCDFSKIAIEYASSQSPNSIFKIVDALKLSSIFNTEFDVVLSLETLEHVDDPQKMINEMQTILKSDGLLILSMPYDNKVAGEHLHAFKYNDFLNFFDDDKCFIIDIYRYSENYKNLMCVAKKI